MLVPLFQLLVRDLPLIMAGAICPPNTPDTSALQCFVCLHCHLTQPQHPLPHLCRWVHSTGPTNSDPSAFTVDFSPDIKGVDVISQLRQLDVQPVYTGEDSSKWRVEEGSLLPRMRLSHWVRIPTRPSRVAQSMVLGEEKEAFSGALSEERTAWGRFSATPHVVRLGGYEVHRHNPVEQRCPHTDKGKDRQCSLPMNLLLTFPSGRLVPIFLHQSHDLWLYQCAAHRDVFRLVTVN